MDKKIVNLETGEVTFANFTAEEVTWRKSVLPDELMQSLRLRRNLLLAETDYLALSDVTLSPEMAEYRQALRDLPANTTDPANPSWPVKPGGDS